ncbi:hypothetical protein PF005_g19514 [Phytophthora fragariae]|uniref:Uncharacterized protein n=1 Tax=Phytophthora fragariae TaxID=53985 RepID=A0A6A3EWK0_9STRA|nr:hypothetical protein PF003_g10211 [Phytophthora fragariae]KAE8936747.1 hypothetical protein PF009_g13331 [Phytophthora fragariae]KAE9094980.1 hypothetical protein PF007_g17568 [Phytophthora fragariae]KAE9142418.1 hypothetical protein PF006_g12459 [Phytophthora fragariae]KAE9189767.1 hypothetical protein PF005_g19514 [Phytophthora fragariae]
MTTMMTVLPAWASTPQCQASFCRCVSKLLTRMKMTPSTPQSSGICVIQRQIRSQS